VKKNKKTIIIIISAIVIVAIVTTGTILTINAINTKNAEKSVIIPTKETAKDLQNKAEEARANNDKTKAKQLLLEAQQQYETVPKTDTTVNAQEDIKAQLFLLEQAATPATPATTEPQQ
jgi:flagellar basal body-associated protein FliL